MKILTKTNFKYFLDCQESLWLLKNKPEIYPIGEFSLFAEKLMREGYEVEDYAKQLFAIGIEILNNASPEFTKDVMQREGNVWFQPSFVTPKNIFARIDILERFEDNSFHLYEVKSSTSIKKDRKHRHIEDVCFQKYVLTECGFKVSKVSIIHLNKEYIKSGSINPFEMLEISDVTDKVDEIYSSVVNQINSASNFINKQTINENECSCLRKTRSNHCDAFKYFNKDIPEYSIYEIVRISANKVCTLVDNDIYDIVDIPLDFNLNDNQQVQVESVKRDEPIIHVTNISKELNTLEFPLHFMDYETYGSAIPKLDGLRPHQHVPFQVSIHTLEEDGTIEHFEYLLNEMQIPREMVAAMQNFTGQIGTFISWHASFEISKNKDLIKWLPEYSDYLTFINEHTYDLEDIFKKDYVDYRFHGSTSIKKIQPVLIPELSYSELEVSDGTMAMDTWGRMVLNKNHEIDKDITRQNLLSYCKLDTLAMVKIYEFLNDLD